MAVLSCSIQSCGTANDSRTDASRLVSQARIHRAKSAQPQNGVLYNLSENLAMKNFMNKVVNFLKAEDGPTAVEYAIMLALIVIVCLVAITNVGTAANAVFEDVADKLEAL